MSNSLATKLVEKNQTDQAPIGVMIVDDSAVARGFIRKYIESQNIAKVVAAAANGADALKLLKSNDVEVIILDLEMPVMDGLTAIPLILKEKPGVRIIVTSALSQKNAKIGLEALEKGAQEFLAKPDAMGDMGAEYSRDLVQKVTELGAAYRRKTGQGKTTSADPVTKPRAKTQSSHQRPRLNFKPKAIAIGSSTGGPAALRELLPRLSSDITQPIFITQHMPEEFTKTLADNLEQLTGRPTKEGLDGQRVVPGHSYVAPGGCHMSVRAINESVHINLLDTAPENFCRPAVDPMLRGLLKAYGRELLVVILTGMGSDGLLGATSIVENGGRVIAQDETSSVVWGMPRAVSEAGICSFVGPLESLATEINQTAL